MNKHREEKEVLRLFQQAKKKRTEGEYLKALQFIEIALEIQPDNVSFLLFKSTLLESDILHHANNEVLQIYNRILELEPENAEAWFSKGCALFDMNREEEAEQCFEMARNFGYLK